MRPLARGVVLRVVEQVRGACGPALPLTITIVMRYSYDVCIMRCGSAPRDREVYTGVLV